MPSVNYTAQVGKFGRRIQWVAELTLDRCTLTYTEGLCTASDAGDGSRCHYSFATCQAPLAYDKGTRVLRFCLADVPWDDQTVMALPMLNGAVVTPQSVDPGKLYVYPEKIKLDALYDFGHPPMDHDKGGTTPDERYNTTRTVEFWRGLVARNPNYVNRPLKLYRGFSDDGTFDWADFEQVGPDYEMTGIEFNENSVTISAESPLAKLNKVKIPSKIGSDNILMTDISNSATSIEVLRASEVFDPDQLTLSLVYLKFNEEIVQVTSVDTSTNLLTVVRGRLGTTAVAHLSRTKFAEVLFLGVDNGALDPTPMNSIDATKLLLERTGIDLADIESDDFDDIKAYLWSENDVQGFTTKPETAAKIIRRFRQTRGMIVYINRSRKWSVRALHPYVTDAVADWTDENFISLRVKADDEDRITRASIWYDPNKDSPGDSPGDYNQAVITVSATLEQDNNFGEVKEGAVYDPFLAAGYPPGRARVITHRMVSRLQRGVRLYIVEVDLVDADQVDVGDMVSLTSEKIIDFSGSPKKTLGVIVARKPDQNRTKIMFDVVDVLYGSGRFLRISANSTPDYDAASEDDKTHGHWGDEQNRVGSLKEEGYTLW